MKRFCQHAIITVCIASIFSIGLANAQKLRGIKQAKFKKDTFNIVRYGAVADGITLNTDAINKAIDACNKQGGGTVLVPNGLWVTGPIVIKSNVNCSTAFC